MPEINTAIPTMPPAPARTQAPADFAATADTWVAAMPGRTDALNAWAAEANALAAAVNLDASAGEVARLAAQAAQAAAEVAKTAAEAAEANAGASASAAGASEANAALSENVAASSAAAAAVSETNAATSEANAAQSEAAAAASEVNAANSANASAAGFNPSMLPTAVADGTQQILMRNSAGTAIEAVDATTAGQVLVSDGMGFIATGAPGQLVVYAVDEKPSGTSGGTTIANTWVQRDLNTLKINQIGATMTANEISGLEGDFVVEAKGKSWEGDACHFRHALYKNGSLLEAGGNLYRNGNGDTGIETSVVSTVTLTPSDTLSLFYYSSAAQGTNGLGLGYAAAGVPEIYSEMKIWRA